MTKVPRNKGSYEERKDGSFQVKYPLGWSEAKKIYDVYNETVPTEAEAIALIKAINDYVYHGGLPANVPTWRAGVKGDQTAAGKTVNEFVDEFIDFRKKQKKVAERTLSSYSECYKRIKPYIGDLSLSAVTPYELDKAFASMRSDEADNLAGKPYSGTTLQKTYAFLRMLFDKAVDYEYIPRNPCLKIDRPKRDTKEKTSLSAEQAQALFTQIRAEPLAAKPIGLALCLCCGLRLSEMLALKWTDYRAGEISVTKSLVQEKQGFKKTKNEETREVPCTASCMALLDDWKAAQQLWYKSMELDWSESAPIVNSGVANHTLQRSFGKWYEQNREHYGLAGDITTHSLRHTYVTLLSRDCGTDRKTAQSLSGHKSDQAFNIYTHTDEESRQRAVARLDSILAPSDNVARCCNCKLWTASPIDVTQGVCWADAEAGPVVTNGISGCISNSFSIKMAS